MKLQMFPVIKLGEPSRQVASPMDSLKHRLATAEPGEVIQVTPEQYKTLTTQHPIHVYDPSTPVIKPPERYDCFVIRKFGTSERVPEKLFIHGRVYHLAHARLERQDDWLPHEFMVSCKFSLERKPKDATRRRAE